RRPARAERPPAPTASFLPPLGRAQLAQLQGHLVRMALAVEVRGLLADDDPAPFDGAHLAAVRPDRGTHLHDVAEALIVLDDGPRIAGLVDERDEPELPELVALQRRPGLVQPGRSGAWRPERVAAADGIVGLVVLRLDGDGVLHRRRRLGRG